MKRPSSLCFECLSRTCRKGHSRTITQRHASILLLVAQGKTNAEIAQALAISLGTVKVYLCRIYTAAGFRSRTEAALWAERNRTLIGVIAQ